MRSSVILVRNPGGGRACSGTRRQSDLRVRQTPEGLGGTALVHPRHPLHDEVLEQPTLVSRGRWYGERDARVEAEVPSASADPAASPRRSRPLDPDPSSRHLRSSVRVQCDHVRDRVALEKLPSRLGKRIPVTGECYFARIPLRWTQGHTPVEERHPRKRPHLTRVGSPQRPIMPPRDGSADAWLAHSAANDLPLSWSSGLAA